LDPETGKAEGVVVYGEEPMRKLLLIPLLAICVLALPSCRVSSGVYGAKDGIVLCQATAIDVAEKPYPIAHGVNVGRYANCNGEEYVSPHLTVTVYLHHVETNVDGFIISRVCNSSGPIALAQTSGFKVSTADTWDCPGGAPGETFFAESLVRGYIGNSYYESWQRSPHEVWTLPA
jgi:hypothetical protein